MTPLQNILILARRYHQTGDYLQAEQAYRLLLASDPECVDGWFSLGNLLAERSRFADAAPCYQEVVRLAPSNALAHNNLGVTFAEQKLFAQALSCYRQAIGLQPDYSEAHYNLGNALKEQRRFEEAEACYREALRLRPQFAGAHLNCGIALAAQGKPAEALCEYEEGLRLSPKSVEAHNNIGLALSHVGRHEEALTWYQRALDLLPDYPDAHYNRALSWLALGNFAQGWTEFEWRWRLAEIPPRTFSRPCWDGAPLNGRTILLHSEQGLGDTLQFIRYAPFVQERGGKTLVACQEALLPLLTRCRGIDRLVPINSIVPPFDVHCPLLSLARVFACGAATVPAAVPYIAADPQRVERWRQELAGLNGFKIGIAWQGSPGYRWDRLRSFALTHFAALAALPSVRLISLQKGPGADQLATATFPVLDLAATADNSGGAFMDTAAVIDCLHLVITSDTAVAHLAGAMAKPVWVALSLAPEWRWLLEREGSPWYPTMRLFRQTRFGDWNEVFDRMARALAGEMKV
jgi:tetratricopeptide (TPR) repeat protein